jgi:hypothetical protein
MSEVKVNKISPRTNCGTVQLGDSGDTITIPAGATITNNGTQTGFGRTGTVDWQTGSIKTGDFTGASGEGYFVNTTSGEITMTLPSASAGDIISVQDYNNTFDSNKFSVQAGSGVKINGGSAAGKVELDTEGEGLTLVYVDSTVGWRSIHNSNFADQSATASFITATGGTITTVCTNYKVHTFTGPGTFTVCSVGNSLGSNTVSYMVVAGGGGGGRNAGGGGGGGGFREGRTSQCTSWTASPIACTSGSNAGLPVSAQGYPIAVGGGGAGGGGSNAVQGSTSSFSTISSAGGGRAGSRSGLTASGGDGGSGGGAAGDNTSAGSGNTPPTTPPQGNNGGASASGDTGAGGGGATAAAGNAASGGAATPGGAGGTTSITGSPVMYAAGGGGGGYPCGSGREGGNGGGSGGGCATNSPNNPGNVAALAGTANKATGGGGGSNQSSQHNGGAGGSGVVVIRYRFQ